MIGSSHHRPREAGFDLTPMIDIVMLLIVFFTLTSQFSRSGLAPLDLPKERGEAAAEQAPLTIFLDLARDGSLSQNGRPLDMEALAAQIAAGGRDKSGGPKSDLVLRADRRTPAVHVNRVAAALTKAGVKVWRLATAGEGPAPEPGP